MERLNSEKSYFENSSNLQSTMNSRQSKLVKLRISKRKPKKNTKKRSVKKVKWNSAKITNFHF